MQALAFVRSFLSTSGATTFVGEFKVCVRELDVLRGSWIHQERPDVCAGCDELGYEGVSQRWTEVAVRGLEKLASRVARQNGDKVFVVKRRDCDSTHDVRLLWFARLRFPIVC
jgi:hypothetical protein